MQSPSLFGIECVDNSGALRVAFSRDVFDHVSTEQCIVTYQLYLPDR